jgi:hypothetical protein
MMERVFSLAMAVTLAALLLAVSLQALLGPTPNSVFGLLASSLGIAVIEPYGRYVVTALQLAAVVLLLIPRTRAKGAVLAFVICIGAVAMHLSPWLGINLPLAEQASAQLAAGATAAEIRAMNLPSDSGGMFLLALAICVLAVGNLYIERAKIRAMAPRSRKPAGAFA